MDSLIKTNFSTQVFTALQNSLIPFSYKSNKDDFLRVEKQIKIYSECLQKKDTSIFQFIYPPVIKSILNQNKLNTLSPNEKIEMLKSIDKLQVSQGLNFETIAPFFLYAYTMPFKLFRLIAPKLVAWSCQSLY